jgi:argininosuccinate lyase
MQDSIKIAQDIIKANNTKRFTIRATELFDKLMQANVPYSDAYRICESREGVEGIRREWKCGHCYMFVD